MALYNVEVWSISRQRWDVIFTGAAQSATEVWSRLRNNGMAPVLRRLH